MINNFDRKSFGFSIGQYTTKLIRSEFQQPSIYREDRFIKFLEILFTFSKGLYVVSKFGWTISFRTLFDFLICVFWKWTRHYKRHRLHTDHLGNQLFFVESKSIVRPYFIMATCEIIKRYNYKCAAKNCRLHLGLLNYVLKEMKHGFCQDVWRAEIVKVCTQLWYKCEFRNVQYISCHGLQCII